MEIFEIVIFILAYTMGVITIFLEIICYKRRIEYIETILFSASFLLLIISLSISKLFDLINRNSTDHLGFFISISMVLLGLFTPLNIFAERKVKISLSIKRGLFIISGILLLMIIGNKVFQFITFIDNLVILFLGIAVISSMLIVRNSKPQLRIKHREKQERVMAVVFLVFMPITLFIDFFSERVRFLSYFDSDFKLTLPVLFILLAASKFFDDLTRLSLFRIDNSIQQQNADNYQLTQREREIAELLIRGYSYSKIGEALFISIPTVKTHVTNIYRKVNVSNKMELFNMLTN